MNELIFFLHILFLLLTLFVVIRLGKMALSFFVIFCVLCANLFVIKQISFFGLTITPSDPFTIISFLSINLLQEWYGKELSKKTLQLALFFSLVFLGASQIHLCYSPSLMDQTDSSFHKIFSFSPRIIFSSLFVFFISQKCNLTLFSWMHRISTLSLNRRITISSLISQLLDTLLFSFLALYGIAERIFHIILVSYSIKVLCIFFSHPLVSLYRRFRKEGEQYV